MKGRIWWGRSWRGHNHQLTHELDWGNWRFLSPSHLWNVPSACLPAPRGCPKDTALNVVLRPAGQRVRD